MNSSMIYSSMINFYVLIHFTNIYSVGKDSSQGIAFSNCL